MNKPSKLEKELLANKVGKLLSTGNIPQKLEDGSTNQDWLDARAIFPASQIADLLGLHGKQRKWDLILQKAGLMERPVDVDNPAKKFGRDTEEHAIDAFQLLTGKLVSKIGSVRSEDYDFLSASPDGIVAEEGRLVEVKCGYTKEQSDFKIDPGHYIQIQTQLFCCELQECYLITFFDDQINWKIIKYDHAVFHPILTYLVKLDQFITLTREINENNFSHYSDTQ